MRRMLMLLAGIGLTVMAGCRHVEKSQIVKTFQDSGGGDANQSTPDGIAQFLVTHDDVRNRITPLCKQARSQAAADWSTTDEGRICAGNDSANFFGKAKIKSDGTKF
jgi:hypothetical protein